ncbi:MAG TPA: ShlB/FhaC/HecB family hemolysin secretion/activation protein [Rhodanobacteraceae bacterium]|nr:ShlB/FhaC/HecB family hemolysin secretion/activation protein [Rhodanobacteraceae bacterium]
MNANRATLRSVLVLILLATLPSIAHAQTAPPSGGQLLQQVQPPPPPPPQKSAPVTIQAPSQAPAAATVAFRVTHIAIDGNSVFDTATLHALVANAEGTRLDLVGLDAVAARITAFYHAHGYPLARAIVPAQTIQDGTVHVQVLEALYDHVRLDNRSRVDANLLHAFLATLAPGALITTAGLDNSLLRLGDLPGVDARATLSPGSQVGTSDLDVNVEPLPTVYGNVRLDNSGNRYTGRLRAGASLYAANPFRHGDLLSLDALTSGRDLTYGRLGYQTTLNGHGTALGGSTSALRYRLGRGLEALAAHGVAGVESAWLQRPFVRTAASSMYGRLQVDAKRLRDRIDSTGLRDDRHSHSATASLVMQSVDTLGGGGITTSSLGVTRGLLYFDDAVAAAADAATAQTAGSFTRWNASVARLQRLATHTRLYVALTSQGTHGNLDASEQLQLGGVDSVRGYEVGTLAGASGYQASVELRHDLVWSGPGQWEGRVFFDAGDVSVNPRPWTAGPNRAHLSAWGLGLQWTGPDQWLASLQVAQPISSTRDLAGTPPPTRVWLQISRGF